MVFLDFKSKNNLVFRDCLINYSFEIGRSKRNNYTEKLCEENCSFKFLTNLCVLVLLVDTQGERWDLLKVNVLFSVNSRDLLSSLEGVSDEYVLNTSVVRELPNHLVAIKG